MQKARAKREVQCRRRVQGEKYSAVQKARAEREVQYMAAKYNTWLLVYRMQRAHAKEKHNARVNVQRGKYGARVNVQVEKYSARVHVK